MGRKQVEKKAPVVSDAPAANAAQPAAPQQNMENLWSYKPGLNLRTAVGVTAVTSGFNFASRGMDKYTMAEHVVAVVITMVLALLVGASPGIKDLASWLQGKTDNFKNKQAVAGFMLILVPMYFTFGLYGPNGVATLVSMVIAILSFTMS